MADELSKVLNKLRGSHPAHKFAPPASATAIVAAERELGLRFPAEYQQLLAAFNGAQLFEWSRYHLFHVKDPASDYKQPYPGNRVQRSKEPFDDPPADLIQIAEDFTGVSFHLDCADGRVWVYAPPCERLDDDEVGPQFRSLAGWLSEVAEEGDDDE